MDGVRVTITDDAVHVTYPTCNISFERQNKTGKPELFGNDLSRAFFAVNMLRDLSIPPAELTVNGEENNAGVTV
jgi:hypothetical protein